MAHPRIPLLNFGLAASLLISAGTGLHAAPSNGPTVADAVVLTAWLQVEDLLTMADVVVEVEVNGTMNRGSVAENGRIDVILPAGVEAVLRISKPDHLTKEVVVDTRHVNDGGFDGKQRHVSCAVILQAKEHMAGLNYPGPVGTIGFDEGGGCMTVEHDRRLVTERRQQVVVF